MRGGNANLERERGRSNHVGQDETLAGEGVTAGSRPLGQGRSQGGRQRTLPQQVKCIRGALLPSEHGTSGVYPGRCEAGTSPTSRLSLLPVSLRERRGHHIACQPSTGPSPVSPILMPALFGPHSALSITPVLTGPVTIGLGICFQDLAMWDLLTQPHSARWACPTKWEGRALGLKQGNARANNR